ncbi:MAG: hypothetical protein K1X29_00900 [Bdellovibrionales bacterium]|nr:hypothetical protein [Bdellovibrionales bacterium]
MSQKSWLPLTEYSGKYGVSISTLRRKIKSGEIEYEFIEGKYLLCDQQLVKEKRVSPSMGKISATVTAPPQNKNGGGVIHEHSKIKSKTTPSLLLDLDPEPILSTTNRILSELKQAYNEALQEKEKLVQQLKEELVDLRTLTKVLETENERLRNVSLNQWIESG